MTVTAAHEATTPETHQVTLLELFFDLVFVFAVSQLSHHLLQHLSWRGAAETLVMLIAVFAVWLSTSWSATLISAEESRTRRLILAVMFASLFMNASLIRGFTTSGWAFVVPLLMIQVGRALWALVNAPTAVFRNHYVRMLIWLGATTPFWIAGAVVAPAHRLWWWAIAAGIELIGRWTAHPVPGRRLQSEHLPFDADHLLERCRLFLLIALGETVFTTSMALSAAPIRLTTLATGTFALAVIVALWALSFGRSHRLIIRHMAKTSDPVFTSRYAANALLVMVGGLIAVAVANEMVIAHPRRHTSLALSLLLAGGPMLFLAAQGWYLWSVPRIRSRFHLIGVAALALVGVGALAARSDVALILVGTTLTTLAVLDQRPT